MRSVPLVPTQGNEVDFVPTEEIQDPELKALLATLPGDITQMNLPSPNRSTVDASIHAGRGFMEAATFKLNGERYDVRWRKLIGEPGDPPDESLHLLLGVAVPSQEDSAPSAGRVHSLITELDRVGEALEKLQQAVKVTSTISDALVVLGESGSTLHMNASEVVEAELASRPSVMAYIAEEERGALAAFLADQAPFRALLAIPVEISVGWMAHEDQTLRVLIVRDISQRKAMETALIQSELSARITRDELQRVVDNAACPFVSVDTALHVTGWNRAAARVTGLSEVLPAPAPIWIYI
eukprot:tig00000743_g3874.t1